jgi:ABC-type transporter Mla subunit MlaD
MTRLPPPDEPVRALRALTGRVTAPFDAVFDLLEESTTTLRSQADALAAAGQALEDAAGLMKAQAELFERTLDTLRAPTELAKSIAGVERHPRAGREP